ncbi:uncharacterized protein Z518_02091 [Rhinocladiella mackenziei CBS 650.93]|uniref:Amidohydrolase-related domain-containing protein n=1 Tax=Rhinocladiella mackenziei CBS 650.93 TaxID=1442369 RepID=A0A0D2HAE7_9EURO|nr:uncharacterized protein Z518_02091 [Rhinocladiella mackenziei CBS 650.93]KIX07438.1 hypothetical protein Z518_02091 [Rhinocladiella mackenziei CBS 650.93]
MTDLAVAGFKNRWPWALHQGSSESSHKAIRDACAGQDIGLTMYCAEALKEISIYRGNYDYKTNLIGSGEKTILGHMVNLDLEMDTPLLARTGEPVAHKSASNCKLASGIAPAPEMLAAKINAGDEIGRLIHNGVRRDAKLLTADEALEMATINGARASGLEKFMGSAEEGKNNDFIVLYASGFHCVPFDRD